MLLLLPQLSVLLQHAPLKRAQLDRKDGLPGGAPRKAGGQVAVGKQHLWHVVHDRPRQVQETVEENEV